MSKLKLKRSKRDLHVISSAAVDKGVEAAVESEPAKTTKKWVSRVMLNTSSPSNGPQVHHFFDPLAGP